MGRDSWAELEQAALAFLSAIDADCGLDAVLFLRRTGSVLASWSREVVRLDVVSVMAATMLASVDTLVESLGGPSSQSISVSCGDQEIMATKIGSMAFLFVIAPKTIRPSALRKEVRRLAAALTRGTAPTHGRLEESSRHPRVKVHPPG